MLVSAKELATKLIVHFLRECKMIQSDNFYEKQWLKQELLRVKLLILARNLGI